ncbi:hypothetical protein D1872_286110 [compost metagenome]
MQPVFRLIPKGRLGQRLFHDFIQLLFIPDAMIPWPEGNIFVYGLMERIRSLPDHADFLAQQYHIGLRIIDILIPDPDLPGNLSPVD